MWTLRHKCILLSAKKKKNVACGKRCTDCLTEAVDDTIFTSYGMTDDNRHTRKLKYVGMFEFAHLR